MNNVMYGAKRRTPADERGSAMIVTLLVAAVLTALGGIVFAVGLNNLQNAGRDRLAGGAFGASEGGVAQALAFIRSDGVASLKCDVPAVAGTDCSLLWGRDNPKIVSLAGGRQYSVWIQRIEKFNPPATKTGTFLVHATGTAGAGPGLRKVDLRVVVRPLSYPIGIYADDIVDAGTPTVRKESLFSQDCITGRDKMTFEGNDPYQGIPAAAHTTRYDSEKVNGACSSSNSDNIHRPPPPVTNPGVCHTSYPNDQDAQGGDLTGTTCDNLTGGYPQTSFFDLAALKSYGYQQPRGLTNGEYAALKSKAQEQGTYYTDTSFRGPSTDPPPYPNAVYYFNLKPGGGTVDIQHEFDLFGKAYCGSRSVVIVVEGGDLHVNSGADIVGAIFVPDGNYRGNGNHAIIGTLYAKTIDKLNGTADFTLEGPTPNCFFDNFPGSLLSVTSQRFREVDR